jgi:DtxR family transcriptional regulator, Mn-dependent transcriptional regulator
MDTTAILSEHTEMYLVTIARIKEANPARPAPLSLLAGELDVLPVSANQMVRSLEESGLVVYTPYKGVELTETGQLAALRILRHRRLWEVFLVERLFYAPNEASTLACRLEHSLPPEAAERLAAYLGYPTENPLGLAIPEPEDAVLPIQQTSLSQLGLNQSGTVLRIGADLAARNFLQGQGIVAGARVSLLARGGNGDLLVDSGDGRLISLADKMARLIFLQIDPRAE